MKRNTYLLIALLMVLFTPLSMHAFGTSPTGVSPTEKPVIMGCDGVTVVGGSGSITVSGLGSYSHIQVFTPDFASQVFNQEITTATLTVPITTAGNYIVKIWSNPNPGEFCENNFPVTVGGGGGGSTLTLNGCNNASATAAVGATSAIVNYTMPTATTTCATAGTTVTRTSGGASGTAFPVGASQVCFSATDACGNTKTCCITITVTAAAGCSNVTSGGTISKSCNNGVITLSGTAPVGGSGNLEYQWLRATGACPTSISQAVAGATNATLVVNSSSVTATTFYVRCSRRAGCSDAASWEPGESNCISIAAGECPTTGGGSNICTSPAANIIGGSGSIAITGITTGCSMIQVFNSSWSQVYSQQVNGTTATIPSLPAGSYIVKVTVLGAGCAWPSVCDVQVTVTVGGNTDPCATDVTPPTFSGCPTTINLTTSGTCANASWTAPTATDNCGTPTVAQVLGGANGSCFPIGTTLVKYMATDAKGNTAICVFNVVVTRIVVDPCATDAIAPTFTSCPTNISLTTSGTCANASWTAPTATDNCGTPTVAQVLGGANGSCFPIGTTLVKYMATDAKGNTAICVFNVVVTRIVVDPCATDVTAPVIVCPANIVKTPTSAGTCWNVSWTAPTATDNCSTATVTQTAGPANGSCIAPGTYTVTYKATDAKGNTATCSFTITVNTFNPCATDVTPPTIHCPANIVKTPTSAGSCWTVSWTAPTATDNCGTPAITQTAGPTNGSCLAPNTYTVTYKATDAKGNVATCSFTILVKAYLNCNSVTGNTIAKSCVNDVPSLTGSNLAGYEYVWLRSTTACPNQTSQAIAGATGQHYTLPSRVTTTTYFVRCARQIGCTTWGAINESNCITVYATDCAPTVCSPRSTPSGWMYLGVFGTSHYFKYTVGDVNSTDAKSRAQAIGGRLPVIKSLAQNAFIQSKIGSGNAWIGIRRSGNTNVWLWDNNAVATYYNWNSGEPNDYGGNEDCVAMYGSSGKWNDANCHDINWLVAEIPCGGVGAYLATNDVLNMEAAAELDRTRIEWTNNTGYKNDFFTVEKMSNVTGDFEKLDIVNNKYSTDLNEHYSTYDNAPTEGDNTYRIKVTYVDGTIKVSDTKIVTYKGLAGLRLFPNPATDVLSLDLTTYKGKSVSVYLYNQFGQQVLTHQVEKSNGETVNLNVSEQQAGNYLIRVTSKDRKDVVKQVHITK